MIFPQWIQTLWEGFTTLVPFFFVAGFAWLKTQFASRSEVNDLNTNMEKVLLRLDEMKDDIDASPNRTDILAQIAVTNARLSAVEADIRGVSRQLVTQDQYLRIIIEKGMNRDS